MKEHEISPKKDRFILKQEDIRFIGDEQPDTLQIAEGKRFFERILKKIRR